MLPDHPAFAPLSALHLDEALCDDRDTDSLARVLAMSPLPVTNADGRVIRTVEGPPGLKAEAYERRVYETGELLVRPATWHDRFNVAAWRLFPKTKAALNAGHVAELDRQTSTRRSRRRDALTALDEDGLVVACADPALERGIREFRWRDVFVVHRARARASLAAVVLGHALLEKLLDPFVGITGKAIFVPVPPEHFETSWPERLALLDSQAALLVAGLESPADLSPLPVLGLPGWWPANEAPAFYDDTGHFRPGRRRDAPS